MAGLDSGYDLVIAEGFKGSGVPKVLVVRGSGPAPKVENVIAVVGPRGGADDGVPHYGAGEVNKLAALLQERFLKEKSDTTRHRHL